MPTVKNFPKQEMLDLLYEEVPKDSPNSGAVIVLNEITDQDRWNTIHDFIFRLPGQPENEAWSTYYTKGATETQGTSPWEYDKEVECTLVEAVPVTQIEWKEK